MTPTPEARSAALAFARHQKSATQEYVDAAMGLLPHMEGTEYQAQCAMRILADKVEELAAWKESAMTVTAECDIQAVGTLLGLTLGQPIYPAIEPGIRALQEKLRTCREALESITHDMGASQNIHNLCASTLNLTK